MMMMTTMMYVWPHDDNDDDKHIFHSAYRGKAHYSNSILLCIHSFRNQEIDLCLKLGLGDQYPCSLVKVE